MKKVLSLILALTMAFSFVTPALAYEISPFAAPVNDILSTIVVKLDDAVEVMTVGTSSITVKPGTTRNQLLSQIESRDDMTLDFTVTRNNEVVWGGELADGDVLNVALRGKDYYGSYKIELYDQAKIDEWGDYWDDPTYRSIDETVNANVPTFKDVDYVITDAKYAHLVQNNYQETYYHTLTMSGNNAATGEMRTQELVFHGDAIQAAIDEASANGGGRVVLPKTTQGDVETVYYTAAIWIKSNVNLYIAEGVRLAFVRNIDNEAYPIVLTQFEGSDLYNYSPFIYALNEKNIAITGKGTIDGQADHANWMNWKRGGSVLGQRVGDYNPQANRLTGGYSSGSNQSANGVALKAGDPIVGHNIDKVDVTRRIYTATGEAPAAGTQIPVVEDGVTKWIDIPADAFIGSAHQGTANFTPIENQPSRLRPCFIEPYLSENILIEGITINNSPMWEVHPTRSTNILIRNVVIDTEWNNNDGINPDSCKNVVIEDNEINTGDDCIAIKSGKNEDGQRRDTYSENIIIRRVNFARGHGGITIGSECAGAVRNLFTTDNYFNSASLQTVIRFKTNSKRSSKVIEKMYHKDSTVLRATNQFLLAQTQYSAGGIDAGDYGAFIPVIKDLYIYNFTSSADGLGDGLGMNTTRAFTIQAYARAPISDIHVKNCTFVGAGGPPGGSAAQLDNIRGFELVNVKMTPKGSASAEPTVYNTTPIEVTDVKVSDGERIVSLDETKEFFQQRIGSNTLTVTGKVVGMAAGTTVQVTTDRGSASPQTGSVTTATLEADGTFSATITLKDDPFAVNKANHFVSVAAYYNIDNTLPKANQDVKVYKVQYSENPDAKSVALNWNTYAMAGSYDNENGETIVLDATYDAGLYANPRLEWATGDATIVSLKSQAGSQITMQARTVGWTDITVSLYDGNTLIGTDVCAVSVVDNYDRTTFLTLDLTASSLRLTKDGGAKEITPIFYPVDFLELNKAYFAQLEVVNDYDTGVITVALVDGKVVVTPVGAGETTFTVRSAENGRAATCTVIVGEGELDVTGVTAGTQGVTNLDVGQSAQLTANVVGGTSDLIWTSSNAYIASVDENGMVTGRSTSNYKERGNKVKGDHSVRSTNPATESLYDDFQTVTITATSVVGGFSASFEVMVYPLDVTATSLSINRETEAVALGGEEKFLTAAVNPATILSPDVVWSSSNEGVLQVVTVADTIFGAPQAKLVPVAAGTAVVTATYAGLSDACTVTVTDGVVMVSEIGLQESAAIEVDEYRQLTTSVTPNAENQKLFWLSTDRTAVTVNNEGIIQGYNTYEESETLSATVYAFAIDSLSEAQKEELYFTIDPLKKPNEQAASNELGELRNISIDKAALARLQAILDDPNVVWEKCEVTVVNPSLYLRNLRIPAETITSDSVALLWNRASLYYTSDIDRSEILANGKTVATIGNEMSYTVRGLKPDTAYTFEVITYFGGGNSVSATIQATTKAAATAVLNVLEAPFNAVGDGSTMDTAAIQAAIDACPVGGEVWLPGGHVYYSGALFLKSDMTFRVDGILLGSTDPKDYPRMVTRWEGIRKIYQPASEWLYGATGLIYPGEAGYLDTAWPTIKAGNTDNEYSHSSLITVGVYDEGENTYTGPFNTHDVVICGNGQINANGYSLGFNEGPNNAANGGISNSDGGFKNGASPKRNATIRGRAISVHNTDGIYLLDVMVANSPSWQIQFIYSRNITVDHIASIANGNADTKVGSGSNKRHYILNGDGTNLDSSTQGNIINSYYRAGDDAIASKSGKDFEGRMLGKPTAYFRATDILGDKSRYGFIIGSEMAGGAHDLLFQNSEFKNNESDSILWIKAPPCRGGLVEDVVYKDIFNNHTNRPAIRAAASYSDGSSNVSAPVETVIRRITYENIYEPNGANTTASSIAGSLDTKFNVEVPITDVHLLGLKLERAFTLTRSNNIRIFDNTIRGVYTTIATTGTQVSNVTQLNTADPTVVNWTGLTANGVSETETTTELTLTFDVDPITLTERNLTVTGATKGKLMGTGTTRTLLISDITVENAEDVVVEITRQPFGYEVTETSKAVPVYEKPPVPQVNIRTTTPTLINAPVEYTVSIANARKIMNMTILFEVDGDMLTGRGVEMLCNGFEAMGDIENAIKWTRLEENIWQGEILLMYLGGSEGFTAAEETDIFKAIYDANKVGNASMKLTRVRIAGLDDAGQGIYFDCEIGVDTATTLIKEPDKVYSIYDLNKDGVVDERDLAMAQRYYMIKEGDAGWDEAKVCDFNNDGIVDINDLLALFLNFGT